MSDKGSISVDIVGGDRRQWTGGPVHLKLLDPFKPSEKTISDHTTQAGVSNVVFNGVPADRGQPYSLLAFAEDHRDAGVFPLKPSPDQELKTTMMLVREPVRIDLSGFSFAALEPASHPFHQALTSAGIDEPAFRALDPERIAGALNIEAKLRNTTLAGTRALDLLKRIGNSAGEGVHGIFQDRIFAFVDPVMPDLVREELEASKTFRELLESENEVFHRGFPVSFKQQVTFGSLQLSFAERPEDNGLLAADIDIDLFTDIGHLGEVLTNFILTQRTDPFTVYRQLFDQHIATLYDLSEAVVRVGAP